MEALKNRIRTDGCVLSEQILLVDSFINHQVDPQLMADIGQAFRQRFGHQNVQKVVTIESSGIAPACMTALALGVPMVILKKSVSSILSDGIVQTEVYSYTKQRPYCLTLKSKFIRPGERVLLIDDFLANGEAAFGGIRLIEQVGGVVVGVGAVISKSFQSGENKLRQAGYAVHALASIAHMEEGAVTFAPEDDGIN